MIINNLLYKVNYSLGNYKDIKSCELLILETRIPREDKYTSIRLLIIL